MKLIKSFFIITFTYINLNAQTKINPTIGINYTYQFENSFYISGFDRVFAHDFGLSGGIRIKKHVFIDIGLGVALSESGIISSLQIRSLTNFMGVNYRILKPNHIFSPLIGANFGYEINSNARGKFVSNKYSGIVDKDNVYADPKFIYNKNRYFGQVKIALDVEYKNISLRTGINFNFSSFDETKFASPIPNYEKGVQANVFYLNMGVVAGVMYTFPMKKKNLINE